ncbi:MAG: hypothetical protein ACT4OX_12745 [Actinomycetota bacterium]
MAPIRTKRDADHLDLIAAERAEREGDDIVVTTGPPRGWRPPAWMLIAGAAVGTIALIGAGVAALGGDDDVPASAVDVTDEAVSSIGVAPRADARSQVQPDPTTPIVAPDDAIAADEPAPTPGDASAAPAPALAPAPGPATLEARVDPSAAAVTAGTPVTVTLTVHNSGGVAGDYGYDNDGCDPYLVAPSDLMCTQVARMLQIASGASASTTVTIDTARATPGVYTVAIGDQSVVVTISA